MPLSQGINIYLLYHILVIINRQNKYIIFLKNSWNN